jgi:PmbA protein
LGGNGFRGGVSRPGPSMSNFCIAPGQTTEAELLSSIKDGIWVEQVLGAGQSNLLAGEFSVNLDLGYRIQNGEIVGRIKNTMVAGNLFEAFNADLQALSAEQSWVFGSALLPGILFRKLGVAARS